MDIPVVVAGRKSLSSHAFPVNWLVTSFGLDLDGFGSLSEIPSRETKPGPWWCKMTSLRLRVLSLRLQRVVCLRFGTSVYFSPTQLLIFA